jgi:hypothetical protein
MDVLVLFLYEKNLQLIYPVHLDQYHIYHRNLLKNLNEGKRNIDFSFIDMKMFKPVCDGCFSTCAL